MAREARISILLAGAAVGAYKVCQADFVSGFMKPQKAMVPDA